MMESVQSSGDNGAVANFYGELGLDRTWSVEQLRAKLGKLQLHWKRRASLAGKHGEEARERLSVIEAALGTFVDEDAKERYDHQLRRAETVGADDAVNWVARAWTYYFNEDYDAATVAARKARGQGPGDPAAYVVSAWIELAQNQAKRAAEYASEAYVLDEDGENAFEVQEVRGVTFHVLKQYDRAIDAFKKALAHAPSSQLSVVYLRLARTQFQTRVYKEAFLSCLAGLREDKDQQLEDELLECAYSIIKPNMRRGDGSFRPLLAGYAISPSADRALNSYFDKVEKLLELEACQISPQTVVRKKPRIGLDDAIYLWWPALCLLSACLIYWYPDSIYPLAGFLITLSVTVFLALLFYFDWRGYKRELEMRALEEYEYEEISKRISTLRHELGL